MSTGPPRRRLKVVCPHDCPDTCVMTVDVEGDRAVAIGGDLDHWFTQGFLCAKVNQYLERVYSPDRVLHPLKRIGKKGEGKFERITWDEALDQVATRFRQVIAEHGPQAILPYSYAGNMGLLSYGSMDRRFFNALGASLLDRTICASAGVAGLEATVGKSMGFDPEAVVHARFIVAWGANIVSSNVHLWPFIEEARRRGARFVAVDPYRSRTAEKADQHLALLPGTDAALALGVMHVIFRDGLQDRDYVEKYATGVDALQERAKAWPPERVAQVTGLAAADVEAFAREYATTSPSAIRLNYGLNRHAGAGAAVRTIASLPALTGAWRHAGGGVLLSTSGTFPVDSDALERPDLIPRGTRTLNMSQLGRILLDPALAPPVKALFVYNSNPAAVAPEQDQVLAGLAREDLFVAVHDLFLTDTADFADIVLPATTTLEHYDIHKAYGHLYASLSRPAIAPRGECKPNTEVFRLLARRMKLDHPSLAETDEQMARQALRWDHAHLDGVSFERLEREGSIRLNVGDPFAPFAKGRFPTPSGRCDLFRPTLTIHPDDAGARRIEDGAMVRTFNDRGSYLARAVVSEAARPGVVVGLSIWWPKTCPGGRNANAVTSQELTDMGGGATFYDVLVQVEPA